MNRVRLSFAPAQTNRAELLDLGRGTPSQVQASLRDIQRINTYLGGAKVVCDATFQMLHRANLSQATLLDIGTGSADIPRRLLQLGHQQKVTLNILALDNQWRHLQVARSETGDCPAIRLLQADAFRLPLPDAGVDIVMASLFLHHFLPPQVHALLREFSRVARVGWIVNDLVRAYVPLAFFRVTWPIFARSYITRHDGTASIRRAYTLNEMRQILQPLDLPQMQVTLRAHFPYRMSITGEKLAAI